MPKKRIVSPVHKYDKMKELVDSCPNPFEFRSQHFKEYRAIISKKWFEVLFGRPVPTTSEWKEYYKRKG